MFQKFDNIQHILHILTRRHTHTHFSIHTGFPALPYVRLDQWKYQEESTSEWQASFCLSYCRYHCLSCTHSTSELTSLSRHSSFNCIWTSSRPWCDCLYAPSPSNTSLWIAWIENGETACHRIQCLLGQSDNITWVYTCKHQKHRANQRDQRWRTWANVTLARTEGFLFLHKCRRFIRDPLHITILWQLRQWQCVQVRFTLQPTSENDTANLASS